MTRQPPSSSSASTRSFSRKLVAAHHALYLGERETFEETLRRLSFERIVPKEGWHIVRPRPRELGPDAPYLARRGPSALPIRAVPALYK